MATNDSRSIWVTSQETAFEDGSYVNPFGSISKALDYAHPGQIIVLKGGKFIGNVTIQKGGTIDKPVRIVPEEGAVVECIASCWFFYDVSDIICSKIVFKESPGIALSVIGKCMRNRFEYLQFINCSIENGSACTLFFGGSGQACNTVESCRFERTPKAISADGQGRGASVGLMITEGDLEEGDPNRNHIISKNVFSGYGHGIIAGSGDLTAGEYGHQIVYNTIDNCAVEGILVKCGDTLVKGNVVRNCGRHSITVAGGEGSSIEDNRIVDCGYGIRVTGNGHSISNNCIIRCREDSLGVLSSISPQTASALNIIIEKNTIIEWGIAGQKKNCGVRIEPETTCVVRENLFHGTGAPYEAVDGEKSNDHETIGKSPLEEKKYLITDNIASGACIPLNGCIRLDVAFQSPAFDNYLNNSGYGADGWMLSPEAYDPGPETMYVPSCNEGTTIGEEEEVGETVSEADFAAVEEAEEDTELLETDGDAADVSVRSLFFDENDDISRLSMLDRGFSSEEIDEQET
jgi:hypothetical protein